MKIINALLVAGVALASGGTGAALAHNAAPDRPVQPVCLSTTEDSTIIGCNYHDGGWYQR